MGETIVISPINSKRIDKSKIKDYHLSQSNINKNEFDIWQRRYWEHTIINENDLYKHADYIHYNPLKHGLIDVVKDWSYSTFNKFVKQGFYEENWMNLEDRYKIRDLDLE